MTQYHSETYISTSRRNLGAPEFPVTGWRVPLGLASPRRPPSPAPLPAPSCCHPLHLWPPLPRAGEDAVVSCSLWCCSNLSVRFRSLMSSIRTAAYRSRQHRAPSPTSARLWHRLGCDDHGSSLQVPGRRSPWPTRKLLRVALRPSPNRLLYTCSASLFSAPFPHPFSFTHLHRHHRWYFGSSSLLSVALNFVRHRALPRLLHRLHRADCGLTAACPYSPWWVPSRSRMRILARWTAPQTMEPISRYIPMCPTPTCWNSNGSLRS